MTASIQHMATTYYHRREPDRLPRVLLWLLTGVVCLLAGWLLPVSYNSIHPGLLEFAGRQGPKIDDLAKEQIAKLRLGPAEMFVKLAKELETPDSQRLEQQLVKTSAEYPALAFWGAKDAQIEQLFGTNAQSSNLSLLQVFMSDQVRQAVHPYLGDSISPNVQSIVRTRELAGYKRFVPANKPGGQPLDATIVLTGLFCASERFTPSLVAEITGIADRASNGEDMAPLEEVYYALLVLGNRLNWGQLTELLKVFETVSDLTRFAALINKWPDDMPLIYCASLLKPSPSATADYFDSRGTEAAGELRRAAASGIAALELLIERQVPIADVPGFGFPLAAQLVIKYPFPMYVAKWSLFALGSLALVFSWANLVRREPQGLAQPFASGASRTNVPYGTDLLEQDRTTSVSGLRLFVRLVFILIVLGGLALLSEPLLMKKANEPNPAASKRFAGLSNSPVAPDKANNPPLKAMDQSTIISVMLFGLLQIIVYMVCLMKIREIDLQPSPASLKLRLVENEENLFDGGLYVGIAGTAAALVLQVLQVIEANLLAAYASNLFGIMCVAFIKIGHVRSFKRNLILQMQAESSNA
jgi:hypothetical protein